MSGVICQNAASLPHTHRVLYNGPIHMFYLQNIHSVGSGFPSNTRLLVPTRDLKRHFDRLSRFVQLTRVPSTQGNHATCDMWKKAADSIYASTTSIVLQWRKKLNEKWQKFWRTLVAYKMTHKISLKCVCLCVCVCACVRACVRACVCVCV